MKERVLHVEVHRQDDYYRVQVKEWPHCFAIGQDFNELIEGLTDAIGLYVTSDEQVFTRVGLRIEEITVRIGSEGALEPPRIDPRETLPGRLPDPGPHGYWVFNGPLRR